MSVEVSLAIAHEMIDAARSEAARLGVGMSIAVVDDGGNLKAFVRMDDAELAGIELARDKAYTALANSAATHELAQLAAPGGAAVRPPCARRGALRHLRRRDSRAARRPVRRGDRRERRGRRAGHRLRRGRSRGLGALRGRREEAGLRMS